MARTNPDVDPAHVLRTRRHKIDAICDELAGLGPHASRVQVVDVLERGLSQKDLSFLDDLEGGHRRIVDQAAVEYARFAPTQASSATSAAAFVRILLLQSLDLAWWGKLPAFADRDDVARSAELVDLRKLRRAGKVEFGFGVASDGLLHRGRDFLVQRLWPEREPRGPGLPFACARPEIVAMLNEVARMTAARAPAGAPPIWVNSIVRSVEHQKKLQRLGFSALLPSAHCHGWAADIELTWFERFGAAEALREVLLGQLDAGVLNVIDEGRAWHVCLAPEHVGRFAADVVAVE